MQDKQNLYDILNGEHHVSLGHYFDFITQSIFTHTELVPNDAFNWAGQKVNEQISSENQLFYIGDAWCVAELIGGKLGISEEVRTNAYSRVRAEMLTADYAIPKSESLAEVLKNIDVEMKVLLTNSPFESGEVFLEYLEVLPYFDQAIYDGKKPNGMEQVLKRLMEKGYKPEEILSIGDNPNNDLYPARKLGARTVYISDYHQVDQTPWDYKVHTINELVSILQEFQTKAMSKL
jgi:HAD superfamily hydrolase (TIGR01549 family)